MLRLGLGFNVFEETERETDRRDRDIIYTDRQKRQRGREIDETESMDYF